MALGYRSDPGWLRPFGPSDAAGVGVDVADIAVDRIVGSDRSRIKKSAPTGAEPVSSQHQSHPVIEPLDQAHFSFGSDISTKNTR